MRHAECLSRNSDMKRQSLSNKRAAKCCPGFLCRLRKYSKKIKAAFVIKAALNQIVKDQ
jgi:hypothetical protein